MFVVKRIFWIVLGYYLAATSAAAIAIVLTTIQGVLFRTSVATIETLGTLVFAPAVALLIGYWVMLPATLVIAIGEAVGNRKSYYYCLGGILSSAAYLLYIHFFPSRIPVHVSAGYAVTVLISGLVGGWTFWAVAGRHASGFLRRHER